MYIDESILEEFFCETEIVISDYLDVQLNVIKDNTDIINASIQVVPYNEYLLTLYSGLFYGIDNIVKKLLTRYDDENYLWFSKLAENNIVNFMNLTIDWNLIEENEINKTYLNNLFTSLIIQNIIFHETGHIIGEHLTEEREYYEFDARKVGNIEAQCKEMYADYVSARVLFNTLRNYYEEEFSRDVRFNWNDNQDVKKILQHIFVVGFLTLYFQFNLNSDDSIISFNTIHPDKKVRLFYCLLSFRDDVITWMKTEEVTEKNIFNIDDLFDKLFIDEMAILIMSFLSLSDLEFTSIMTNEIVEHYFSLLDYSGEKTINGEVGFLSPIDETYKNSVKNFVERVSDPDPFGTEWYKEISNILDSNVDD